MHESRLKMMVGWSRVIAEGERERGMDASELWVTDR